MIAIRAIPLILSGYPAKQALARIRLQRMRDRAVESYETKDFIRRREAALRHTRARA